MTDLKARIKQLFSANKDEIIEVRRHLHQYPELSFQEVKTSEFISKKLTEWGIPHYPVADTGIIAEIKGKDPESRLIVLRGDIDGLPIKENTGLEFTSKNDGVMHACGHDIHTSCVLGAGKIINQLKEEVQGTVKLLFQPGEEKLPGGATKVIASGLLNDPVPDLILGQHVYAELEVGKVGFRPGMYMASADEIYIDVKGPGGHAAMPDKTVDVLVVASKLILELKQVVEDSTNSIPTVLTFGKIEGMGATNVIPKLVHIEGTFRTMNEEWRQKVHAELERLCKIIAIEYGAEINIEVRKGYPCLINDEEASNSAKRIAQSFLGNDNVIDLDIRMTSEDFSFYTQLYKSCFYRLGIRTPGSEITNLHSPEFKVDERSLETGIEFMSFAALTMLNQ